eukprot:gene29544-54316_t
MCGLGDIAPIAVAFVATKGEAAHVPLHRLRIAGPGGAALPFHQRSGAERCPYEANPGQLELHAREGPAWEGSVTARSDDTVEDLRGRLPPKGGRVLGVDALTLGFYGVRPDDVLE